MNGIFPFLMERTRRKPLSLTIETGRRAAVLGPGTRGVRVRGRNDVCGQHGDVGRLTFPV